MHVHGIAADVLDRAHQSCLFDRFAWLEALHRHCMPAATPHILHAREGSAEAWLFLAQAHDRRLCAMANYYSFSFRPVFAGDPDAATRQRLVETMACNAGHETARISIYPVLADDGTLDLLLAGFRQAGWRGTARPMGINHFLRVGARDFASYWADRPGNLRNIVRRRLRDTRLTFDIHHDYSDALWADYLAVYGKSWKSPEPHYPFLREMAALEGKAGTLRLGFARQDGRPVATQLWTVENGVALIHKLAHDKADDDGSPGTLLSHHMFRSAIDDDGVATIDYGTGDNPYKCEWMEEQRALFRVDCFNPRFASTWLPATRSAIYGLVGKDAKR